MTVTVTDDRHGDNFEPEAECPSLSAELELLLHYQLQLHSNRLGIIMMLADTLKLASLDSEPLSPTERTPGPGASGCQCRRPVTVGGPSSKVLTSMRLKFIKQKVK
jgi:hypothetical protein